MTTTPRAPGARRVRIVTHVVLVAVFALGWWLLLDLRDQLSGEPWRTVANAAALVSAAFAGRHVFDLVGVIRGRRRRDGADDHGGER